MKKYILLALVALLCHSTLMAVPAFPLKKNVKLTDGTFVTITATGDENLSFWRTDDGRAVRALGEGKYKLIPSAEFEAMQAAASQIRQVNNARRAKQRKVGTMVDNLTGTKKGLVILVSYKDVDFTVSNPGSFFKRFFNEKGFSDYGFKGSVGDYFLEQSYGTFGIDFDVAGPYTLTKNRQYYGGHSGDSHDAKAKEMIEEAVKLADADVDFTNYDWDKDGTVDQVFVVYAGRGENQDTENLRDCIWPHESSIDATYDGMKIHTYGCSCELQDATNPDGIGTACHEFSHCLGFPDMYDTVNGTSCGPLTWDLMNYGCYNGYTYKGTYLSSVLPSGYTSYERMAAGWLTPTEITSQTQVSGLKPLATNPEAYIIYNKGNRNEYYLLENRQKIGMDAGLYDHGLLVLHVDYSASDWSGNVVNGSSKHHRMDVMAADGNSGDGYGSGDTYPGTNKVTSLTNYTSPCAATVFNKNSDGSYYMNCNLEHITESSDGLISFLAGRPDLAAPALKDPSNVTTTSFTASWDAVDGATGYELELTETPVKNLETALMLNEDFAGCYKSSNGFTDISSKLSSYTTSKANFTGSKLYQSPNYLKIGTNTVNGYLDTPVLDLPSTGEVTLVLGVTPATEGTEVTGTINLNVNTASNTVESFPIKFSTACTLLYNTTATIDHYWLFDIRPESMMYMNKLQVYDGRWTAEELGIKAANAAPRRVKTTTVKETGTSHTFSGLSTSAVYTLRVRAYDSERQSQWSEAQTSLAPTAIQTVQAETTTDGKLYDLSGREVTRATRGIYVRNGKKYIVK